MGNPEGLYFFSPFALCGSQGDNSFSPNEQSLMFGEKVTWKLPFIPKLFLFKLTGHVIDFCSSKIQPAATDTPPTPCLSNCTHLGIRGSCHVLTPVCVCKKYTCPCTVVLCSVEREGRLFLVTILKKKIRTKGLFKAISILSFCQSWGKALEPSDCFVLKHCLHRFTAYPELLLKLTNPGTSMFSFAFLFLDFETAQAPKLDFFTPRLGVCFSKI